MVEHRAAADLSWENTSRRRPVTGRTGEHRGRGRNGGLSTAPSDHEITPPEPQLERCSQCGFPIVDLKAAKRVEVDPARPYVHLSCFERQPARPELRDASLVRAAVEGRGTEDALHDPSALHTRLRRLALQDYLNGRLHLRGERPREFFDEASPRFMSTQYLFQSDIRAAEDWLASIDGALAAISARANGKAILDRMLDAGVDNGQRAALWRDLATRVREEHEVPGKCRATYACSTTGELPRPVREGGVLEPPCNR